jgi:rare lipoprotein A
VSRRTAYVVAALLGTGTLILPSLSWAGSGGSGPSPSGGSSSTSSSKGVVQPANATVSASGDGVSVSTKESGFLKGNLKFTGSVSQGAGHDIVEIERRGQETNGVWDPTAHATVGANGHYTVTWHANHSGHFAFRAALEPAVFGRTIAASPGVQVNVFALSIATWFGPGLYGNGTACGEHLTNSILGVANRTLPCGTLVEVYYGGHTIVVPVIDRGPYANGADWDLTVATHNKLHTPGIATVGTFLLPAKK